MATKGTNAKIKELKGIKPEKISAEELSSIQELVNNINRNHLQIGQLETQKHNVLHQLAGLNDELVSTRENLKSAYGTDDINVADGIINYNEAN
tara:strand:- start:506 stop:787 length:282 start_codon:yes stop_codon:yes gene_type:complete